MDLAVVKPTIELTITKIVSVEATEVAMVITIAIGTKTIEAMGIEGTETAEEMKAI